LICNEAKKYYEIEKGRGSQLFLSPLLKTENMLTYVIHNGTEKKINMEMKR